MYQTMKDRSLSAFRNTALAAAFAAGLVLAAVATPTPAQAQTGARSTAAPAMQMGDKDKDKDKNKAKEKAADSKNSAGALIRIRQAQANSSKDKDKDKEKKAEPKKQTEAKGKDSAPTEKKDPRNQPQTKDQPRTRDGGSSARPDSDNRPPFRNEDPRARESRERSSREAQNNRDDRAGQFERDRSRSYERDSDRSERFGPFNTRDRDRDRDRNDWGRTDNDRFDSPQHRSRDWWDDRDRDYRWDNRRERNSRFGIHFDFDNWDIDIHIGDSLRGFWYRDCRPDHRCHRHNCRYCCTPAPRYTWTCSAGHRCWRHDCRFCYPVVYVYQPVCRSDHRCGLVTCSYCHPPVVVTYDSNYFERTLMHGWDEIAFCEYRDARDTFECLIKLDKYDPRPRIGLAVAQGLRGNESTATDEMRDAVDLNPAALRSVPCDDTIEGKIVQLLYTFEDRVRQDCDDEDDLFMLASLYTILGDDESGYDAVKTGIYSGDCSSEAYKLRDFLACRVYSDDRARW